MSVQSIVNLIGWVGPFNTSVQALGVLAEDDSIDLWLFNFTLWTTTNEVQWVTLE